MSASARPMIQVAFALLDNALEKLAGRSAGWREDNHLQAEGEREAGTEDGNAAKRTRARRKHAHKRVARAVGARTKTSCQIDAGYCSTRRTRVSWHRVVEWTEESACTHT